MFKFLNCKKFSDRVRDRADIYNTLKKRSYLIYIEVKECVREVRLCEHYRDQYYEIN